MQKKTNFLKTILRNVSQFSSTYNFLYRTKCLYSSHPLPQVELSKPSDGYLHIGDRVCLLHTPTKTVVSAHVTSARAFDATRLESGCGVTCSRQLTPCPRNVFVITRYRGVLYIAIIIFAKLRGKKPTPVSLSIIIISDSLIYMFHHSYGESEAKEGEVVCYGQPVALVTLPDEGGQVKSCVSSIVLLPRSPPPPLLSLLL